MAGALLEISGLDISFDTPEGVRRLASDISLTADRGEIVGLVGESGCGKSITAHAILGLLPLNGRITGGSIRLSGQELTNLSEDELDAVRGREAAMIFQDISGTLNPVLTIGRQMTEGMQRHLGISRREAEKEAVYQMERVSLPDAERMMKRYPHQLSGGQRQRVMIAMALCLKPKLLIADEPTTALDVTIQLQLMSLLRQLRDETGMAILLVTHDMGVIAELTNKVAVMYAGQIVESADTRTILTKPKHPYTKALLRAAPDLHSGREIRLESIPGSVPDDYSALAACRFAGRCPYGSMCPGQHETPSEHLLPDGSRVCCIRVGGDGCA